MSFSIDTCEVTQNISIVCYMKMIIIASSFENKNNILIDKKEECFRKLFVCSFKTFHEDSIVLKKIDHVEFL